MVVDAASRQAGVLVASGSSGLGGGLDHMWSILSNEPEARYSPDGENATE